MYTYGNMYLINSYKFGGGAPAVDPDAQAFITAASITDPTQQSAIDTLVVQLKADGIWTKMKALYPFVGGTASTHKYNLKDPQDTDAAFRLVFNGGWTHSANGALPNGTNAFADSKLIPSAQLSLNSTHISYYSRTSGATNYCFGAANAGLTNRTLWLFTASTNFISINAQPAGYFAYSGATSLSMLVANRTAPNLSNAWAAGIKKQTSTNASASLTTVAVYFGGNNADGTANSFTTAQCAFASIGDGLTDTEASDFYTAVQAFQTSLSRQV
jgi:hypothetical protein